MASLLVVTECEKQRIELGTVQLERPVFSSGLRKAYDNM